MANRVGCRLGISECLVANMLTEFDNYTKSGNVIHKKLTTVPGSPITYLLWSQQMFFHGASARGECTLSSNKHSGKKYA